MFRSTAPSTHRLQTFLFFACFAAFLLLFSGAAAQGNLLVTPKRVVFEGTKRSEEINLANIGKDTATYMISFIQIRMKEDGTFEKITEPDSAQRFADKYVRFFPRTVTLAPNEAQTVKMQLTKKGELETGEYRSHLYFRAVPKGTPLGEEAKAVDSSISVKLIPVFGISMPIIIRAGESNAQVKFSDVAYVEKESTPLVKMALVRSGNMSVYGDISIDHISADGVTSRVGAIKGLAVYTPTAKRKVELPLDKSAGIDYRSGRLRIIYNDQSIKPVKLAEAEILLK